MKVEDMIEEVADLIGRNSPCVMTKDEARSLARLVAPLIAAAEREACAKVADGYSDAIARLSCGVVPSVIEVACSTIAAAIRARQEDGA